MTSTDIIFTSFALSETSNIFSEISKLAFAACSFAVEISFKDSDVICIFSKSSLACELNFFIISLTTLESSLYCSPTFTRTW